MSRGIFQKFSDALNKSPLPTSSSETTQSSSADLREETSGESDDEDNASIDVSGQARVANLV